MTNPSAPTDNSSAAPGAGSASGQQLTDRQISDAGRQLAFAVAAQSDDAAAVDQAMSDALGAAGPDSFGAVAGNAVTVLATEIVAGLLNKADRGGMPRLRTDLLVAAAAATPDTSSTDNGPAAA